MKRRIENGVTILTVSTGKEKISPYTGVYYGKRFDNYDSVISHKGKRHHLGTYKNVDDAIAVRKEAEAQVAAGTFVEWYEGWKESRKK